MVPGSSLKISSYIEYGEGIELNRKNKANAFRSIELLNFETF